MKASKEKDDGSMSTFVNVTSEGKHAIRQGRNGVLSVGKKR
jgi:hypothetical protein